jgi:hypothetical protein
MGGLHMLAMMSETALSSEGPRLSGSIARSNR